MKKVEKTVYQSINGQTYDTPHECQLADLREILIRFAEEEFYSGMNPREAGDKLFEKRGYLAAILDGEPLYLEAREARGHVFPGADAGKVSPEPNKKPTASITDWEIENLDGAFTLIGRVYGHPGITDGTVTRTSKLLRLDCVEGEAETLDAIYLLGRMKA